MIDWRKLFIIHSHSKKGHYFFATVLVLVVFVLNLFIKHFLKDYISLSLFLSTTIVAAWVGGIRLGLFTTVLGGLVETLFFMSYPFSFLSDSVEFARIVIYLIQGVFISLVFGELQSAQKRVIEGEKKLYQALKSERAAHLMTEQTLQNLNLSQQQLKIERHRAEEASHAKSLFLANMSHEIRTPLAAILGFTDLLKESHLPEETRQKYLNIIDKTGNNLKEIINDILDISKVEAGHVEIEKIPFSISTLMTEIYSVLNLKCLEKSLSLQFESVGQLPQTLLMDPSRLRQILMNLIGNAIKFTEKGYVKVQYEARDSELFFTISDSGIGITDQQKKRLFKNFSQGDSSISRKYAGTGLGLSLSRQLAKILGGDIELLQSTVGLGSVFLLKVKYEKALSELQTPYQEPSCPVPQMELNAFKGKQILLADDSSDNQFLIQTILSKLGFNVSTVSNGVEALEAVDKQKFDLVLMDMQMPVMDGYTASRELQLKNYQAPVIAITANAMRDDREKCIEAGCKDYVSKPIQKAQLIQVLTRNLKPTPDFQSAIG